MIVVGTAVLAVVAGAVMGVAGIAAGWVPPWGRRRILRPKLWGYGSLAATAGPSGFLFLGSFDGPSGVYGAVMVVGFSIFAVGLYLQVLAQRPAGTP